MARARRSATCPSPRERPRAPPEWGQLPGVCDKEDRRTERGLGPAGFMSLLLLLLLLHGEAGGTA
jgi:hypothetical protein